MWNHLIKIHSSRVVFIPDWMISVIFQVIDESKPPQFVIVVHMAEMDSTNDEDKPEQITTGWVLLRTLNEFQVRLDSSMRAS